MKLSVVIPPLKNGVDVDEDAVEQLVTLLINNGVSGVFIMGGSDEGTWLNSRQRKQIIQYDILLITHNPTDGAEEAVSRHVNGKVA